MSKLQTLGKLPTRVLVGGIFGIICKLVFHLIAFVVGFLYSYRIGIVLVFIYIIHNTISFIVMRGRKIVSEVVDV